MAKRWLVLVLAVALALAVVPLAAAGNGGGGDKGKGKLKFELVGTVSAVTNVSGETTLTVNVKAGNKPVKAFRGKDLSLVVDPGARLRIVSAEGCKTATLAQVRALPGAKVKVCGRVDRSDQAKLVFVALDVKARAATDPEPSPAPGQ